MYEKLLNKYAVNQLAYVVDDIEAVARAHAELFGSGPFLHRGAASEEVTYRGEKTTVTMETAYGQLGDLQIELIKSLTDGADIYNETGRFGFHHVSIWVDDVEEALKDFAAVGCEPAMYMLAGGGLPVFYVDCTELLGHFVEIHMPIPSFWGFVKHAHDEWDGTDPYREMVR